MNKNVQGKEVATGVVKALSAFVQEFEGSLLIPNVVFMNLTHFNSLKEFFPYLIKGLTLNYNKQDYKIIITNDTAVGMAYSYHTDYPLEYNKE
jgi:hypothetical protein